MSHLAPPIRVPPWRRRFLDRALVWLCLGAAGLSMVILLILLASILVQGWEHLTPTLVRSGPSRRPAQAGIFPAMMGTILICAVCAAAALPLGVGTAVLLEEYRPRHRWLARLHALVQLNISNLAGVPSIVYGLLGLTAFVYLFRVVGVDSAGAWAIGTKNDWYHLRLPLGRGVLTGGLTLMLVILPIVIISTQEALRAVPASLRHAALALGATRWQAIWNVALPAAVPGIMTGLILAMSRAIGEAAPILIVAGGVVFITFVPHNLMDSFTAMPLQIYDWASRPHAEFHRLAAAAIVVLLGILLCFNAVAIFIRNKYHRPLS